jgi:hypothetical protein
VPGLVLWVQSGKIGEQLRVPEPGAVVRGHIGLARDMVEAWKVAVVSLMQALETEKIRCRARGGGGPFCLPRLGGRIIR